MQFLKFRERVITGLFFLVLVFLGWICFSCYRSINNSFTSSQWVSHTTAVIAQIHGVMSALEGAEATQRTYLLLSDKKSLDAYRHVANKVKPELEKLANLVKDNPSQVARVQELRPIVQERMDFLEWGIELRKQKSLQAVLDNTGASRGPVLMNQLRKALEALVDEESALLKQRELTSQASMLKTRRIILFCGFLAILSLLCSVVLLRFELKHRQQVTLEKESAKQTALKALAARSIFLANMSHEIRTPLHSIIGLADVWSSLPNETERERCISIIRRAGNLLMNLINDILDLSKIEAGKLEIDNVNFDLAELVEQTMGMIAFRASQKGLSLSYKLEKQVPVHLIGDPNRIRQILLNLLGNAIKFTDTGSVFLKISTEKQGEILFSVRDTGIGIPASKHKNLFEEFNQLDPSISRSYGGTGLGLTISQQLVELMRGRIWFESEESKGSTFFVSLPMEVQLSETVAANQINGKTDHRSLRILIADDIEDNRLLMQLYLKHMPYRLEFAQNGLEAVEKHTATPFDLIFMDMHMPKLNGYDAVRRIRDAEATGKLSRTTIIALTAYALKEDAERSMAAGCDRHVTKPVTRDALQKVIAETSMEASGVTALDETGPVVYLKRELGPLIPGFLENRAKEIDQIKEALQSSHLDAIESLGHTFKGACAQFGFQALFEMGENIREAAKKGDAGTIEQLCGRALAYLKTVNVSYL